MQDHHKPKSGLLAALTLAGITAVASLTGIHMVREQERHVKTVKSYTGVGNGESITYTAVYTDGTKAKTTYNYGPIGELERKVREHLGHPYQGVMMPGDVWEVDGNNHPRKVIKYGHYEW